MQLLLVSVNADDVAIPDEGQRAPVKRLRGHMSNHDACIGRADRSKAQSDSPALSRAFTM